MAWEAFFIVSGYIKDDVHHRVDLVARLGKQNGRHGLLLDFESTPGGRPRHG
jgi:hypothetical protein